MAQARIWLWAAVAIAIVGFASLQLVRSLGPQNGSDAQSLRDGIGGPLDLVDETGAPVTDASFAGQYRLIYFGFANCPDICPTELATMAAAIDALGADGQRVTPIFVTVDPERDTPSVLAGYVPLFHPRLRGLTGTPEQIDAVKRSFRVYAAKAESDGASDYLVDHSSFVFLVAPDGRTADIFTGGMAPAALSAGIAAHLGLAKPSG